MHGGASQRVCPACGAEVGADARFCPACGRPLGSPSDEEPRARDEDNSEASEPLPPDIDFTASSLEARLADEMRPLTMLFADIVGSTALGERLPPDELKELIGECVSRMSRVVEGFGGTVQAYMGDGISTFFGVPVAHEDDPERAAEAGLQILAVVEEYAREIEAAWGIAEFGVRVGINTGQTAVGVVGSGDLQAAAFGDMINIAARLQAAAAPGTIAVGEATAKRLSQHFLLEPLGELQVKGRAAPVNAWRLLGHRAGSEAAGPVSPLVGREAERARLHALVSDLEAGRGQVLFLVGEPGMGKTRLLGELRSIARDAVTWLEGRCPSHGGELVYWPFVEVLRNWLGVAPGGAEVALRARLRAKLSPLLGQSLSEVAPYLARLLHVELDPELDKRLRLADPQTLSSGIARAYRAWLEALAQSGPVVVALDDLQFADPSTRELAEELLDLTDRAPLLLALALRPEAGSEGWKLRLRVLADYLHRVVDVPLSPISREAAVELVDFLAPQALDDATKDDIVERAEGNPLYIEELLRSLREAGALERSRSWTLTVSPDQLIPPNLQSLLVARIDQLPSGPRRLAQLAAVIGRNFPVPVLERLYDGNDLEADLAVLLRADVVRERRRYPELECSFKHRLLQEAALSTLTPERARRLHARVARAFEDLYSDATEEHLELLAHHYARSHDLSKALEYLERAGDKAAALNAKKQARDLWRRALKVAARLGDEAAERRVDGRLAALELADHLTPPGPEQD